MYLHIGNGECIKIGDIIGIFDLENTSISKRTRDFLNKAEKTSEAMGDDFVSVEHLQRVV